MLNLLINNVTFKNFIKYIIMFKMENNIKKIIKRKSFFKSVKKTFTFKISTFNF